MDVYKLGQLFVQKRHELGLTRTELAKRLNAPEKAVSEWEKGLCCPDDAQMNQLAVVLKINIADLINAEIGDDVQSSNINQRQHMEDFLQQFARELHVEPGKPGHVIEARLFGTNLEHTRSCVYTGLSAQMLRNRKFAGKPSVCGGFAAEWKPVGENTRFYFVESYTRHADCYHMKRNHEQNSQLIVNPNQGTEAGLCQQELYVQAGKTYEFRMVAKATDVLCVRVALLNRKGTQIYAEQEISVESSEWKTYETSLVSNAFDDDAQLRISFTQAGSLCLGAVSLLQEGHFHGMRVDVIDCLKEMGIRLLRWPGGNFAGEYNWMDGLLPVDQRSPLESYLGIETQPHSLGYDFHEIGIDEFMALCREVGAEPYITINPAWNTPEENAAWVEYCNGDESTPYGRLRSERGFREPYNVKLWSLGNEFGYGHMEGENTPAGYAGIAMENAQKMLNVSPDLTLCSSGPYPNAVWAEQSAKVLSGVAKLVSQHFYAHDPRFECLDKEKNEYYATVSGVEQLRRKIHENRSLLPENVQISMDEWNVWYSWYRPSQVTDGIFTALTMHMIMEEQQKCGIALSCHFEAINEGAIRVLSDRAYLMAQGQAFAMMKHHVEGQLCSVSQDAAVTEKDGVLTITLINASYDENKPVWLPADGTVLKSILYTSESVAPPSVFAAEKAVLQESDGERMLMMPAHSMALIQIRL